MAQEHSAIPSLYDLTVDNITDNVNLVNSSNPSPRFKFLLERLVIHLDDFARETRLSQDEWLRAIDFLTKTGQTCTDVRQEFSLLSLLVDSIDHPKPPGSTEGTVLGPFHTHDAKHLSHGENMSQDKNGERLLVVCTVKDTNGTAIPDVKIDIWETDSSSKYDVQHSEREKPDGRCVLTSNEKGEFWFQGIVPVPYPIPRRPGWSTLIHVETPSNETKPHAFHVRKAGMEFAHYSLIPKK